MSDYLYISNDGLVKSDNYNFIEVFNKNKEWAEKKKEEWILHLRKIGIKGIHPDDGWVDRENNTVIFENPYYEHFLIEEGDLHFLRIELGPKRDKSEDFIVSEKEIDEVINLLDKYLLLS